MIINVGVNKLKKLSLSVGLSFLLGSLKLRYYNVDVISALTNSLI
jgi:hypothetical protein